MALFSPVYPVLIIIIYFQFGFNCATFTRLTMRLMRALFSALCTLSARCFSMYKNKGYQSNRIASRQAKRRRPRWTMPIHTRVQLLKKITKTEWMNELPKIWMCNWIVAGALHSGLYIFFEFHSIVIMRKKAIWLIKILEYCCCRCCVCVWINRIYIMLMCGDSDKTTKNIFYGKMTPPNYSRVSTFRKNWTIFQNQYTCISR